jgi:hypothetical protein
MNAAADYLTRAIITQRPSDGYINATKMCKVMKKGQLFLYWYHDKGTQAFLKALSVDMRIPRGELVHSGYKRACSWIHPKAAIHMAMWLDAHFAVRVIRWASRFISGDLTLVHDVVERYESANPYAKVLIDREDHELQRRYKALQQVNEGLMAVITEAIKDLEAGTTNLDKVKEQLMVAKDLSSA